MIGFDTIDVLIGVIRGRLQDETSQPSGMRRVDVSAEVAEALSLHIMDVMLAMPEAARTRKIRAAMSETPTGFMFDGFFSDDSYLITKDDDE